MVIVVTEKLHKQFIYSSKTPFSVVEFSNTVTFEEMIVLTSYYRQLQ